MPHWHSPDVTSTISAMNSEPQSSPAAGSPAKHVHRLSVVIPMYNEEDSAVPMVASVHDALKDYPYPWELLLVDDGSIDQTVPRLQEAILQYGSHVRLACLRRNFGQTAAMQAGIDLARGDVIATLDGDLQNDPGDIPRMVSRLLNEDLDLVAGWRKHRQDNLIRRIPSLVANRLIRRITKVRLHDYGCSMKVFRASIIKHVRLYGEMHRFIPAWTATRTAANRIKEEVVNHSARQYGASKYGLSRTFRVLLDLLSVYFFMRYRTSPGHFFGKLGFIFGTLGTIALVYLGALKFIIGEDIGNRPLLLVGVMFIVLAVQLFTTGVLSEIISRTYYESSDNKSYAVYNTDDLLNVSDKDWKAP